MRKVFVWFLLCSFSVSVTPSPFSSSPSPTPQMEEKQTSNPMEWFRSYAMKTMKKNSFLNSTKFFSNNFTSTNSEYKSFTNVLTNPKIGKFGYGVVMGYSSGLCLKKVLEHFFFLKKLSDFEFFRIQISKTAAVLVGGLFLVIQSLASRGYLHVDHQRIRNDFETFLDVNKDGEVNTHDVKAFFSKVTSCIGYNS